MGDWGRKIKEKLAIGDPPRLICTLLLGTWFVLVPSVTDLCQFVVLVYQPVEYEGGSKWVFNGFNRILLIGYIILSNFFGRLVAVLLAPVVDRYNLLCHFYIASMATSSFVFLTTAMLTLVTDIPHQKVTVHFLLPLVMNFFQPYVLAFTARQFNDTIGTKTRMLFTVFYTTQHAFVGVCMAFFFPEAPKHPQAVLKCILAFSMVSTIVSLALLVVMIILIYIKNWLAPGDYDTEEARESLACLAKAICHFKNKNRFERLLATYSRITVYESKKVAKILLVLLAMSYQMSTVELWQLAFVRQFTISAASAPIFSKVEFVSMINLLTAILIPVVQFGLVPSLRKIKLPLPVYSLLICLGYVCLSIGLIANVIIRSTVGHAIQRYNPEVNDARFYVFNAMDTHTYVSEGSLSRDILPPGSIKSVRLKVGQRLHVMNFWYDSHSRKRIRSYQDDLIICSPQGVYQEYLGVMIVWGIRVFAIDICQFLQDFGWVDGFTASHFAVPKLTILCPRHPGTGVSTYFCNEYTEFTILKESYIVKKLRMLNGSRPYRTTLKLDPGYQHSIRIAFHGNALNVENRDISFTPKQGAWYAFVVWSGDVHLKIKYNLVTMKEGFKVNTLTALPQILSAALGLSLLKVVICSMVHINTPDTLAATTWALQCLLERFVCPIFVLFLFIGATNHWFQAAILALAVLFFLCLLAALRIARYWR